MMKSTIRRRTYQAIYRLLDRVQPVDFDCGMICGAICCMDSQDDLEMGIYLLPGEDKIHDKKDPWLKWTKDAAEDYGFPESWNGDVYFVKCQDPPYCPREKRPLQCRSFPALPHFLPNGELVLIYNDVDLPYCCPLMEERLELNFSFLKATHTVWKHLVRDPLIYDLVKKESQEREDPEILYRA